MCGRYLVIDSLSGRLYQLYLFLLDCNFAQVAALCKLCFTDAKLTPEEDFFVGLIKEQLPNLPRTAAGSAVALRIQLMVAQIKNQMPSAGDITNRYSQYLLLLKHVPKAMLV